MFKPFFTPVTGSSTFVWVESPLYAQMLEVSLLLPAHTLNPAHHGGS